MQRAAADVGLVVSLQTLAAGAGGLQQYHAATLGVGRVALDGGSALGLAVLIGSAARGDDGGASAADDDVGFRVDALGGCSRYLDVHDTAVDEDAVVGLQTVVGSRLGIEVDALADDDVVGRVDGVVVVAVDGERAVAANEQLTLAVEGALLVVGFRRGAVGQLVVAFHDEECALLAQQVQCRRVGVGDVGSAELHLVLLVARDGQRAVGGRAADHVADALRLAVVGRDVGPVGGNADAAHLVGRGRRAAERDVHHRCKRVVGHVVLLLGVVGLGGGSGLGGGLVDGHVERQQFACSGRCRTGGAAAVLAGVGRSPAVTVTHVVHVAQRVVCRAALQDGHRDDEYHAVHYLLHHSRIVY